MCNVVNMQLHHRYVQFGQCMHVVNLYSFYASHVQALTQSASFDVWKICARQRSIYVSNFHYYTYLHGYGICVKWPYNCTLTIVGNTCMFLFHIHFHENCTYNLLDINIAKLTCLFKIKLKILIKPSMKIKMFQKSIMLLILKLI